MGVVSSCPEPGPGGGRGRGSTGEGVRGHRWLGCGILEKSGALGRGGLSTSSKAPTTSKHHKIQKTKM